ncbi:MAG: hypothetical protein HY921_02835 [Elusimicrobia bacterium]|nr:hypothetical protein [Elusimicrobiota bacterium]
MRILPAAAALGLCLAAPARAEQSPLLWQERFFFDALLQARDKLSRAQSDPAMIPVLKAIAGQAAQQSANLDQIDQYMKSQHDNLSYAFAQEDPGPSLETIEANFETLSRGSDQIRNNLYYLTARCRMASSQALPDSEMYQAALLILGQIQQLQLKLNSLYLNAVEAHRLVSENSWATSKNFRHKAEALLRSVVRIQDSIFSVYNSGYELAMRCR